MRKGDLTKETILEQAYGLAASCGLDGVSIAQLAGQVAMSKSGLFAHFKSKENLQLEILKWTRGRFIEVVMKPSLAAPRGLQRIRKFFDQWLKWHRSSQIAQNGCLYISASAEFATQDGAVRSFVKETQRELLDSITRIAQGAITTGEFKPDFSSEQFAYEVYSLVLGFHTFKLLLEDNTAERRLKEAFEALLEKYTGDNHA